MAEPTSLQPVLRYLKATVGPESGGVSDGELLRRFASHRDEAAFELLLWRHGAMVQRVCEAVLHDHHAAEDACQATFLILARQAGRIRHDAVAGWLYRVARRLAIRLAQRRERQSTHVLSEVAAPKQPLADDTDVLHEEIARLPDRYRGPVLLCLVEGLTHADAAQRLCWPIGTVAGRLSRAKDLLHRRLTKRGLLLSLPNIGTLLYVDRSTAFTPVFVQQTTQAAIGFAQRSASLTTVSPQVIVLAHGVLRTMKYTKWAYSMSALLLLLGISSGTFVWAQGTKTPDEKAPPTEVSKDTPKPPAKSDSPPSTTLPQRLRSKKNLQQIALAIWNYHDAYGHFPQDITDKTGKPLLSWRVAILPFIEQDNLYKRFKLDEPWDSENNKLFSQTRIKLYTNGLEPADTAETFYQFFAGDGTVLDPSTKLKVTDIRDGTSNTIGVVEAGPSVPWAKPADINYHRKKGIPKLVGPYADVLNVTMMDGSIRQFKPNMDEELLHLLIQYADDRPIDEKKLEAAKAKPTTNTDEEKQFVADAHKKLAKLAGELNTLIDEHIKLKTQIQQRATHATNVEEVADELERLTHQVEHLKRENANLRKELTTPQPSKK